MVFFNQCHVVLDIWKWVSMELFPFLIDEDASVLEQFYHFIFLLLIWLDNSFIKVFTHII